MTTIVPTPATRSLARIMVAEADRRPGADVALRHLRRVEPDQLLALVGLLLTATKAHKKLGRPPKTLTLTEEQRRDGYTRYRRGEYTEFTERAYREYQRENQRRRRARLKQPRAA